MVAQQVGEGGKEVAWEEVGGEVVREGTEAAMAGVEHAGVRAVEKVAEEKAGVWEVGLEVVATEVGQVEGRVGAEEGGMADGRVVVEEVWEALREARVDWGG